jgi:membrane protease subunit (stomatin/prohibitin family)
MGGIDTPRGKFIDHIEWTEPQQSDILTWRFPRYQHEIKMGAKLVVHEGQIAVLANEGRPADVYQPGTYTLGPDNMPLLARLMCWKYAFYSPFSADVYFISMREWTGLKWCTHDPIMMRDPEVGHVRFRAFGTYAFQVIDPTIFLQKLVFTDPSFEAVHSPQKHLREITDHLCDTIVSRVGDVMRTAKISLLELSGTYEKITNLALETIGSNLAAVGLALKTLCIENISSPEVEQARNSRTRTGGLRDKNRYAQYQSAAVFDDVTETLHETSGAGVVWGQQTGVPVNPPSGPPPIPVPFFVAVNGSQTGPFHMSALAEQVRDGSLARETLVWREGMTEWTPAAAVPELQSLFAAVPPPLPVKIKKKTV